MHYSVTDDFLSMSKLPSRLAVIREEKQKKKADRQSAHLQKQHEKLVKTTPSGTWDVSTIEAKISALELRIEVSNVEWDKRKSDQPHDQSVMLSGKLQRKLLGRLAWLRQGQKGNVTVGGTPQPKATRRKAFPMENALRKMKVEGEGCLCCGCPDHVMALCPLNKSKGVQVCFNCGSKDHRLRDCPEERSECNHLAFAVCYICGETSHLSGQCGKPKRTPQPPRERPPKVKKPVDIDAEPFECYLCGSTDHGKKECPHVTNPKCFICGSEDHLRADCPDNDFKCFICGSKAHHVANCPDKPETSGGCYHCGSVEHTRKYCPVRGS